MTYTMVNRSVAFLVGLEGIKGLGFLEPWRAVEEAGGTPELIAQSQDVLRAFDRENNQVTMYVKEGIHDIRSADYDGLVLTGGGVDADALHKDVHALRLVHEFFTEGKPVAAIGESVRTLSEADVVRGRRVSSTPTLAAGLRDAGAECVDEHVVVDRGLVTSGSLDDVPAFCGRLVEEFGEVAPLAAG